MFAIVIATAILVLAEAKVTFPLGYQVYPVPSSRYFCNFSFVILIVVYVVSNTGKELDYIN